jgi:iron complex outermembrane receptor protein
MIKSFWDRLRTGLGNRWVLKSSVFTNYKAFEPRPFDILDDQSTSVGVRSTLNYKNMFFCSV